MTAGRCRSCGAPVEWRAHAETGRLAPIDAAPDPAGRVILVPGGAYRILRAGERSPIGRSTFTSHYATCPRAADWRRKSARRTA